MENKNPKPHKQAAFFNLPVIASGSKKQSPVIASPSGRGNPEKTQHESFSGLLRFRWSLAMTLFNQKQSIRRLGFNPTLFCRAFSLVEMLMALLVASLLLVALAPVMTRKMNDSMTVSIEGTIPGKKTKTHEILFDSDECPGGLDKLKTDSDGSQYCEGEFIVPIGYNGDMKVTVIGAGGGGAAASTAGYVEYTTAGSTNTFTVPLAVNQIEATLVGGGAGGGAGGHIEAHKDYTKSNDETWNVPDVAKGKNILVTACGGGGGGGGGLGATWCAGSPCEAAGGGGSGGYVENKFYSLGSISSIPIRIGGQGGRGAHGHQEAFSGGFTECGIGSGAGGGDRITAYSQVTSCSTLGGNGGSSADSVEAMRFGATGGIVNGSTRAGSGIFYTSSIDTLGVTSMISGGSGNSGGNGGASQFNITSKSPASPGAGGGYYGGGGGGGTASGGGGGGGGPTFFNSTIIAPGGGGGGGIAASTNNTNPHLMGAGGGGGGGTGGGNGGNGGIPSPAQGAGSPGQAGTGGTSGVGATGGVITNSPFPNTNCNGGNGAAKGDTIGTAGGTGALRITYLDYGAGGGGGGAGVIVPIQPVKVSPSESLKITIGNGGTGGKKGYIKQTGTTGTIEAATRGTQVTGDATKNFDTFIKNAANNDVLRARSNGWTPTSGSPTGQVYSWNGAPYYSHEGAVCNGIICTGKNVTIKGFSSDMGRSAGNGTKQGAIDFTNTHTGGNGGQTTLFGKTEHCSAGIGGTNPNIAGGNATGYGGCGGGGGYSLADGGAGSGGYTRISWNKYWDAATESYKYATAGTAGGGAAGNIMTYTITNVKSGDKIKIRIGKGGSGGYIDNNTLKEAQNGGSTVFAQGDSARMVKAGGGGKGGFPQISGTHPDTIVNNGTGGAASNVCIGANKDFYNTLCTSSIKTNCCTRGNNGEAGITEENTSRGGKGESLAGIGNGGQGGTTGNNATGKNADISGYGAGGGGAGILDIGTPAITTYNPNTGGNGSNGKIIIEWWE